MNDYGKTRQELRVVCREVLGLSQPHTDALVCALEKFFQTKELTNVPATLPEPPKVPGLTPPEAA